jgi:hypothetical protein
MPFFLRPLAIGLSMGLLSPTYALTKGPDKDPHHVTWTNKKGKTKCVTKRTKDKAEKCAQVLRRYDFTQVQVGSGMCKSK